jgi:3-phytase
MSAIRLVTTGILFSILFSCSNVDDEPKQVSEKYVETLDSSSFSVYLKTTLDKQKVFTKSITADGETGEVDSEPKTDAADDPAIWVNQKDPTKSLILGTNKKGGIHVYDLQGEELQYIQSGCMNNIDLRDGFNYKGKEVVLVAASNCTLNTITLYYIDKETISLSDTICNIKSDVDLVYGICMYKSANTDDYYVFLNGEGAGVEQWRITSKDDKINSELVRTFNVSSRPEGMVADDEKGILYIGVEEEGILKVKAEPEYAFETDWVDGSNPTDRSFISSDIEGLALYKTDSADYLIASSQGNFSYPVFKIGEPDQYLFSFVIDDGEIDGVVETDGLEIVNVPLNNKYPKGMLVLQDGFNFKGDSIQRQNFKYVSMKKVEQFIK